MTIADTAAELRRLHTAPELLQVVNVWDVVGARAVAALPETRAIATASHSIAASFGYEDGEHIPVELMLDMCGRIARAVDVPVTADLEAGYGDAGETIRRAIGEGIVGCEPRRPAEAARRLGRGRPGRGRRRRCRRRAVRAERPHRRLAP